MGLFSKKPLWQPVHKKAMMAYAAIAGREQGRAQVEGRAFDHVAACRELALLMCGQDKAENVHAMICTLVAERGGYLATLLREHAQALHPGWTPGLLDRICAKISEKGFGPQLVICNVIENTYGRLEAARYAIALVQGKAT